MVSPSGPRAVELGDLEIVSRTSESVKRGKEEFKGLFLRILRNIMREDLLEVCRVREVNCLLKELAITLGLVWVLEAKEIGWLGGEGEFFPERDLRMDQNLEGLREGVDFSRSSCQHRRAYWEKEEAMLLLRVGMLGSAGLEERRRSLCLMRCGTSGGALGIKSLRKPAGIKSFEAFRRILRKVFSPVAQEEGWGREEKVLQLNL